MKSKHKEASTTRGYWEIMTLVSSPGLETCETYKGHLSKTQETPGLQHPWAQCKCRHCQSTRPSSMPSPKPRPLNWSPNPVFLCLVRNHNVFCPWIFLEAELRVINSSVQWYQSADNTAPVLWIIMLITMCYGQKCVKRPTWIPPSYSYYPAEYASIVSVEKTEFSVVVLCVSITAEEKYFLNVNKIERNGKCPILLKMYPCYTLRSSVRKIRTYAKNNLNCIFNF